MDMLELNDAQRNLLTQNGFVVVPSSSEYQQEFYQSQIHGYDDIPVFVTTDSVYHIYHLIFDKMLRDLGEPEYFIRMLGTAHQHHDAGRHSAVSNLERHHA